MRSFLSFTMLSSMMVLGLAACSSFADPPSEITSDSADEVSLASSADADAIDGARTYFAITADLRKCASPMCGGWFLRRLNQPLTRCHDGQFAAMCYTPVLDWSKADLSEALQGKLLDAAHQGALSGDVDAIVRGRFARTNSTTPDPSLGRFVITEAWGAEGSVPAQGAFVRVEDNGLRCLVAPCPSITETTLWM